MNLIKRLRNYMPDGPDGSVHTEAAERIAELEAENEHLRKHWTAKKPADLVWNEVDGLHNESDLQRIAELEAELTTSRKEWNSLLEEAVESVIFEAQLDTVEALLNRWMKQYTEGIDADDFRELYLESLEALEQKHE